MASDFAEFPTRDGNEIPRLPSPCPSISASMLIDSQQFGEFFSELASCGYHIFSRELARKGFYPNRFPEYPPIDWTSLKEGDRITIRAFFAMDKSRTPRVDSGEIELEVECTTGETSLFANILTALPSHFPLAKGTTVELDIDEVLRVQRKTA